MQNCNFGVSKLVRSGCRLTDCANPVEDEVFEEEEFAESEGGLARPCHPDGAGGLRRVAHSAKPGWRFKGVDWLHVVGCYLVGYFLSVGRCLVVSCWLLVGCRLLVVGWSLVG